MDPGYTNLGLSATMATDKLDFKNAQLSPRGATSWLGRLPVELGHAISDMVDSVVPSKQVVYKALWEVHKGPRPTGWELATKTVRAFMHQPILNFLVLRANDFRCEYQKSEPFHSQAVALLAHAQTMGVPVTRMAHKKTYCPESCTNIYADNKSKGVVIAHRQALVGHPPIPHGIKEDDVCDAVNLAWWEPDV